MSADETVDNISEASYKDQIEQKLEKARYRYNAFRCEKVFLAVLTIGLAVAMGTLIARKLVNLPPYTNTILISLFSIYFLVSLYTVFSKWMGKFDAASILDKKMGFKERLITGLEYAEQNENNKFLALLVDEINSKLDDKSIKQSIPHKFPRSTKYLIAVLILFLIFLLVPYKYPIEPDQIVTDVKESVIDTTEESENVVDKDDEIKQEEETGKTQQEQEEDKLAETKIEQPEKSQEEKTESQSTAKKPEGEDKEEQKAQKKPDSLQSRISDLLSNINSRLDQLEGKPKQDDKVESQEPKPQDKKESQTGVYIT